MGGTVLDMFTLGATPWAFSLYSFSARAIQSLPLRLTCLRLFHLPVSPFLLLLLLLFLFPSSSRSVCFSLLFLLFPSPLSFFFYFHEFSQKQHANTRALDERPIMLTEERRRETLEFWLNTVPLMDGASSWRSWKHVIRQIDQRDYVARLRVKYEM